MTPETCENNHESLGGVTRSSVFDHAAKERETNHPSEKTGWQCHATHRNTNIQTHPNKGEIHDRWVNHSHILILVPHADPRDISGNITPASCIGRSEDPHTDQTTSVPLVAPHAGAPLAVLLEALPRPDGQDDAR